MGRVSSIKIERCVVVINAAARVGKVQPGKGLEGDWGQLGCSLGTFWFESGRKNNDRAGTLCVLPRADLFN